MSRPLRLEHPGAIWHITSRGNERRDIFRCDRDRWFFLELLAEVVELNRWVLHAYVLMSNHYHLLVETPVPNLSRGMKRLNEVYASEFNFRHRRVGHLVQGRFKSILVERETHLLELVRYVVLNPVRAGIVSFAGRYRWSNYRATAGLITPPAWLETGWTLAQFQARTPGATLERYRRFVAEGRAASYDPWEQMVGQVYLGSAEFCERIQRLIDSAHRSAAHPTAQRRVVVPTFDAILQEVTSAFGVTCEFLRTRSHAPARKALALLAWQEAGLTLSAVAEWMNLTEQAVGHLVRRGRELEQADAAFAARLALIRERLQVRWGS